MQISTRVKLGRWMIAGAMAIGALVATAHEAQARKGMSLFLTNSLSGTCDVKAGMWGYQSGGGGGTLCEVWVTSGATAFTPCPAAANQFDLMISTDWHNPIGTLLRSTGGWGFPATTNITYDGTGPAVSGCSGVNATATGSSNN
jgi:hypothetical protein